MSLAGPAQASYNPLRKVWADLRAEHRAGRFPPGEHGVSLARTHRFTADPLGLLLAAYERHGPVFTLRVLHQRNVFMLGPEANHFMLVSHADCFRWRDGGFGDLIPLLGDGLLTIDGDYHHRSRRIVLPAFHRERVAAALGVMREEVEQALAPWEDGRAVDLYRWTRAVALRVAMRALFGLEPGPRAFDPAREFERALSFYGREYWLQVLRGPRSPWQAMMRSRARLDGLIRGEVARRRRSGERGEDVLSLLLDATDDDGRALDDRQVRDQVMTLLFAGHDTTTATVSFLFYELARHPAASAPVAAEARAAGAPGFDALMGGALPQLDMALDETLRLYPPAWIGPRRSTRAFELHGRRVPAGVPVNYSSWASHRLPGVWEAPEEFRPARFAPAARKAIPRGAYVPFGGGSRICVGMRFGQLEVKAIAQRALRDFALDLAPGFVLQVRQTPTLGPRSGLPMVIRQR